MVPRLCTITVLCFLAASGLGADDTTERIKGRVLDEAGRPVPGAVRSAWHRSLAIRYSPLPADSLNTGSSFGL